MAEIGDIPHLNIDELYETKQRIDILRISIYNKLLSRIHNKVRMTSKQRTHNQFCYFVMPEILIGYPNYDFNECLIYVINSLENDGFLTKYIHPNLLLISWNHWIPSYVREEIKRKTGKVINKFGIEIDERKSKDCDFGTKKNIHDSSRSVHFSNNTGKTRQDKINETYVPSGKFIYSSELLDTIREKL